MSKFTPITLTATVSSFAGSLLYGESDGAGLQAQYKTFDVVLGSVLRKHMQMLVQENLYFTMV